MEVGTNLNWFVLIGAGIIDSINPCAIGVLVFLLAYLLKSGQKDKGLLIHGCTYLLAVFLTYLLAGLLLLPVIQSMRNFSTNAYLAIAVIIGVFGLLELKEFFKPSKSGSIVEISPKYSAKIKSISQNISNSLFTTFGLWVFVALVELPCTGAVYLAVLALMANSGLSFSNLTMLIIYNLLFITPLIIILILFYRGMKSEIIDGYIKKYKPYMRLLTGLLLLGMAAWMFVFTYF
jgi:cytochrome c biogenesis protein CcdA